MKLGEFRKITKHLSDDFKIELRVRKKFSDDELKEVLYPYPYKTFYTTIEFDDIGYSDKDICIGCEIDKDF